MFWCNVPGTVVDKAAKIITDPEDDEQDAAVGLLGLFDGSGDFVSKTKEENKKKSRSLLDGVDIVGQKESSPDDVSLFSFPENDMPNMSHNNNSTIIVTASAGNDRAVVSSLQQPPPNPHPTDSTNSNSLCGK